MRLIRPRRQLAIRYNDMRALLTAAILAGMWAVPVLAIATVAVRTFMLDHEPALEAGNSIPSFDSAAVYFPDRTHRFADRGAVSRSADPSQSPRERLSAQRLFMN